MEDKTFAYLLLSCKSSQALIDELNDWYFGDIIEAFTEIEDQARSAEDIWTFDWEKQMTRIAPVQLTNGLDVRPLLLEALPSPFTRFDEEGPFGGSTLLFHVTQSKIKENIQGPQSDKRRFYEVLHNTVATALQRNEEILFIGGWGWYYEMEIPNDQQKLFQRMGLPFVTRHI